MKKHSKLSNIEKKIVNSEDLILKKVEKHLGPKGSIFGSKGRYIHNLPTNIVVFNSNIIIDGKKIWYGDVDITKKHNDLVKLSKELEKDVYILPEMAARFGNEESPKLDEASAVYRPDKSFTIANSEYVTFDKKRKVFRYLNHKEQKSKFPQKFKKQKPSKDELKHLVEHYSEENLRKVCVLPDPEKFMSKKRNLSPIDKLHLFLIKKCKSKERAQELFPRMVWGEKYEKEFTKVLKRYIRETLDVQDSYSIKKAISWATFDLPLAAPKRYAGDVKNNLFVRKESPSTEEGESVNPQGLDKESNNKE